MQGQLVALLPFGIANAWRRRDEAGRRGSGALADADGVVGGVSAAAVLQ